VLTRAQDNEELIERVAALDIGKADLVCCLRVPDEGHPGRRMQEVETYSTMTLYRFKTRSDTNTEVPELLKFLSAWPSHSRTPNLPFPDPAEDTRSTAVTGLSAPTGTSAG
jgi:hypothetical protein